MTCSAPALLAKVMCLCPCVICFNGKGIWLHIEHSLCPQANHSDNDRDGTGLVPVPHAAKGSVMVKEEEMDDLAPGTLVDPVRGMQPPKAKLELEPTAFHAMMTLRAWAWIAMAMAFRGGTSWPSTGKAPKGSGKSNLICPKKEILLIT
jgi:hypothetical protein